MLGLSIIVFVMNTTTHSIEARIARIEAVIKYLMSPSLPATKENLDSLFSLGYEKGCLQDELSKARLAQARVIAVMGG
jgi:hypothetical protein